MTTKPSAATGHDALQQARELIRASADAPPRLAQLARHVGLSASHLQRAFRKRFGLSPAEYARSLRLQRLKSALRNSERVTDAIYDAGFSSSSRVYEHTGQLLGMTPASYQDGASGIAIRYTTLATPVGQLLVAATERGICAITLADDDAKLLDELRHEFPGASLSRVDAGRDEWLAAMVARVSRELGLHPRRKMTDTPAPPLDIRATAFQWRVWQALQRIPRGQTRSYAQVAKDIGSPRAVRAVASACAGNRLAVVVPCHRVVRSDGSYGGYRWGVARKQRILDNEKPSAATTGSRRRAG